MSLASSRPLRSRSVVLLDVLVIAWVALWIVMGVWVSREVRGLAVLGDTLDKSAAAIEETTRALEPLSGVPFVGEEIRQLAERAREAAASARVSARSSRDRADRLATLLGVSVAIAPSAPIAIMYLTLRARRLREMAAFRKSTPSHPRADPDFQESLVDPQQPRE